MKPLIISGSDSRGVVGCWLRFPGEAWMGKTWDGQDKMMKDSVNLTKKECTSISIFLAYIRIYEFEFVLEMSLQSHPSVGVGVGI